MGCLSPAAPALPADQVDDRLLERYGELIYARAGIRISSQKRALLSNRLRRRLRATGTPDFESYYELLRRLPPQAAEWAAFLQEVTTHETYLFRDEPQWEWFQKVFLASRIAVAARGGPTALRIWSAAASTGDEAFTAACCIAAVLPDAGRWRIEIVGTDIGAGAIEEARAGVFGPRAMRLVPPALRSRFFLADGGRWRAAPSLARMIQFQPHNLLQPLGQRPFDLVFLKNVLIYFDTASKRRVMANVEPLIKPGGLLVVGAAEGVGDIVRGLIRREPWLYERPATRSEA